MQGVGAKDGVVLVGFSLVVLSLVPLARLAGLPDPTRGLISLAGRGEGSQRLLLRADLLIEPGRLSATSFQIDFFPSGVICRGNVTGIQAYGFDATCRTPTGLLRHVRAHWDHEDGDEAAGTIDEGKLHVSV